MADGPLTEEPLRFGEGGHLLGILTFPGRAVRQAHTLPAFVFLSAGLLHRVGPFRLHVRLARELAQTGFASLRVDLSGRGDSPRRAGLTNQQAEAVDFAEILHVLESRLGRVPLVLAGLCSGADNAVRLTPGDERVVGMLLLDPMCFPDEGFARRAVVERVRKVADPRNVYCWLKRRIRIPGRASASMIEGVDPNSLRDAPNLEQFRAAFASIRDRGGRVLSIFTSGALAHYNREGQLGRSLGIEGYERFGSERFWRHADHTYKLEMQRRRLIGEITAWAQEFARA